MTFSFPTQIEFGEGSVECLKQLVGDLALSKVLVVTDAGLVETASFGQVRRVLESSGIEWALFQDVHANPIESDVRAAWGCYRDHHCEGVLAVGGGSPMDVGKAVRLLVKRPDLRLAEFDGRDDWSGLVPLIAIPTTAGTGSEVGRSSVITPNDSERKSVLFHPELLARVAILDPGLTIGLPAGLSAATGLDALTHCIESYTSPVFHPLCDGIALEGIRLIAEALPRVIKEPADMEARGRMQMAAAMGGVAFQKDLGAVHSMAHPLSALHGMHHGLANALCLTGVMALNAARRPGLYREVAWALGADVRSHDPAKVDDAAIACIKALLDQVSISPGLSGHGIESGDLSRLVEEALLDPCHRTNPVPLSRGDFEGLYRNAL